jgi:hypothetical protein
MNTRNEQYFMDRIRIYEMLTKEEQYASGWGEPEYGEDKTHPVFPEHAVSSETGQPFSLIEWINFTQKYLDEARLAESNYCPDTASVRIRVLKAASLLVTALQVHGKLEDYKNLAGVSSTNYPINHGGLAVLKDLQS